MRGILNIVRVGWQAGIVRIVWLPMTSTPALHATYIEAREAFLSAASAAGARVEHHLHPLTGPSGEELAIDVAELGPEDATNAVLVVSGTHGVEGYCGSALQTGWLAGHAAERPADTAVVFVHALNPFGFAWVRRVNEDNVDLNRNFVDWDAPLPLNEGYERLAGDMVPEDWSDAVQERTSTTLLEIGAEMGFDEFATAVSGGQFLHPQGVFYGGSGPVWSHRWLTDWSSKRFSAVERLAILDLHTGLGPWGHGELISSEHHRSAAYERSRAWWDDITSMADGDSVSAPLEGDWLAAATEFCPGPEITSIAIEYGVIDSISVVQALRADAWLHAYGDPTGPLAPGIRAATRAAFADDDPAWMDAVWPKFHDTLERTFRGLAG
ncbi:hypothetical protein BH10ACT3_BH10ACT3_08810 [soil metagenome]